ncbi:hypothetical protein L218DRAFT_875844 [Marasmius fiardii PR-910]|nr:hypothetical protein L218DRAFT_875844 [Marasmius fiardii PR-910]
MCPWTSPWYAQCLRQTSIDQGIDLLKTLVHSKRRNECTESSLRELNILNDWKVIEALEEMRTQPKYIQGHGSQTNIDLVVNTLDDQRSINNKALLDSGCTGSAISA